MTDPKILVASLAAAFLYVVSPGPAFLALFTVAASRGRVVGAGALVVAAIVGGERDAKAGVKDENWAAAMGTRSLTASGAPHEFRAPGVSNVDGKGPTRGFLAPHQ